MRVTLKGKHVLVVGTKRSGLGAIALLQSAGAHVRAMDAELPPPGALPVPVVPQKPDNIPEHGRDPDLIVLSPAVPFDLPTFTDARRRGVPVIGEVELASYQLEGPVLGITGSNGKTTTTALVGHILRQCGIPCQVGGNIGTAVTTLVATSQPLQWNVLELSSFQLESVEQFHARIAVCLNVTPDHLDRHGTFTHYAAAKARLFERQTDTDRAVLNWEDATCRDYAAQTGARVLWFSSAGPVGQGAWLADGQLLIDGAPFLSQNEIPLRGLHNVENVLAASLSAYAAGAAAEDIGRAVTTFPGVEHRIEFVRTLDGVQYFNDSKATNVDAALKAIEAFADPLWIILGGKDKGASYAPLAPRLREQGRAALLIGEEPPYPYSALPKIEADLSGVLPLVRCGTLANAVQYARQHAEAGDVVLLAPACASFDQFTDFEQRGSTFKQLVGEL